MPICCKCGNDVGDFTRTDGVSFVCQKCFTPKMERDWREMSQLYAETVRSTLIKPETSKQSIKYYWTLQCMCCGEILRYLGYYTDTEFDQIYSESESLEWGYCPLCQIYGGLEIGGSEYDEFAILRGEIHLDDIIKQRKETQSHEHA